MDMVLSVENAEKYLWKEAKLKEGACQGRFTDLFISHDLSVVEHISDKVGVVYQGRMVEFGLAEEIFEKPMHPPLHGGLALRSVCGRFNRSNGAYPSEG